MIVLLVSFSVLYLPPMKFCVLIPSHQHIRNSKHQNRLNISRYFGLKLVLNMLETELDIKPDLVTYVDVHKYDVVLASVHSVDDYWGHAYTFYNRLKGKRKGIWICGGSAIQNLPVLSEMFDFAFVGRAEGILIPFFRSLMSGQLLGGPSIVDFRSYSQDNVYRINYVQKMNPVTVDGEKETMLGCKYNCAYCRYRIAALPPTKRKEDTDTTMPGNEETFWELELKSGQQHTTSLDGLTQGIRYAVSKRISNEAIVRKFQKFSVTNKVVLLKVYLIVGYPGLPDIDLRELRDVFSRIQPFLSDHKYTVKFHVTPFSAEPGTPMQWEPVNIVTDYNSLFRESKSQLRDIHISNNLQAYIMRTTMSNWSVLKRAIHHRAFIQDLDVVRAVAADPFFRSHNYTHQVKVDEAFRRFDVSKFIAEYPIGSQMSSSNIHSWRNQKDVENQGRQVRFALRSLS